jgi:ribulose-phosphate 3-epimerase
VIKKVRQLNVRPGVVLNPSTPLKALYPIMEEVDLVLLMSVNPGFAGQSFIPATLRKIERLRKTVDQNHYALEIEVDGGIKVDNIGEISRAGGDIFVLGTGIFKAKDYGETISQLRQEIAARPTLSPAPACR